MDLLYIWHYYRYWSKILFSTISTPAGPLNSKLNQPNSTDILYSPGMIGIGGLGHPGESMSVVIEKRLSELQEEYDKVKSTWIDPEEFNKIKKQCEEDSQAKQTLEVIFTTANSVD